MFTVIGTDTYVESLKKWSKAEQDVAKKIPKQLAENPLVGRPLSYKFLREKRVGEKRVYYLVYEDLELVLLVATSGKKDQQATIDHIKDELDEFRKLAEKCLSKSLESAFS